MNTEPLLTNSEQKHSSVFISNEYTQTDNDQREERPQTTSCLANLSFGMMFFVCLLALTPLIDIFGIVLQRRPGVWADYQFYYTLQGLTLLCYLQHSFVSLLLPDNISTNWDEFLAYLCCERCCFYKESPSDDNRVAIRENEITRRGRPGMLLTFHLLLGLVVNKYYGSNGASYDVYFFIGAVLFLWVIFYQSRKAILRNFPEQNKMELRGFIAHSIKYFLLVVVLNVYICVDYFNFMVETVPPMNKLLCMDSTHGEWRYVWNTLIQASLAEGIHCSLFFFWFMTAQGTGLLNINSIYRCELRVTHLVQICGVAVTTLLAVYLYNFSAQSHVAIISALIVPNATRCQTFKCAYDVFRPVGSISLLRYNIAINSIWSIWGVVFLLLTIDLIKKRFNDSTIAGKLLHYRDSNGNKMKFHVFISHAQISGGGQTLDLFKELEKRGLIIWYDQVRNDTVDVRTEGMVDGVANSAIFLLFLSGNKKKKDENDNIINPKDWTSPLGRPFCQLEIETARLHGKPFVLVHEERHKENKFDWNFDTSGCPSTNKLVENSGLQYENGETFKEEVFQKFVKSKQQGHRSIMYDRDQGKLEGMMEDLMSQIKVAMDKSNLSNSERSSTMSMN